MCGGVGRLTCALLASQRCELVTEFQHMASLKVTDEMLRVLKLAESNTQISKVCSCCHAACVHNDAAVPIAKSASQEVQSMVAGCSGCGQIPWAALKAIVAELRWVRPRPRPHTICSPPMQHSGLMEWY